MIMINNEWEKIETLDDAYKIIEDNLGFWFKDKIREIIDDYISENTYQLEIYDLKDTIDDYRDKNYDLKKRIEELEEKIDNINE